MRLDCNDDGPNLFRFQPRQRMVFLRPAELVTGVIMNTYNPVSENLNSTKPSNGGEAEGNCVVVRRGGKQPDAKEQSQIVMNSIRCLSLASLPVNGVSKMGVRAGDIGNTSTGSAKWGRSAKWGQT